MASPRFRHGAESLDWRGHRGNGRDATRVVALIEVRVMTQYEWKDHDNRYDPSVLLTIVLGIATAVVLATLL